MNTTRMETLSPSVWKTRAEKRQAAFEKRMIERQLVRLMHKDMGVLQSRLPVKRLSKNIFEKKNDALRNRPYSASTWEAECRKVFKPEFREKRFFVDHPALVVKLSQKPYVIVVLVSNMLFYFIRSYKDGIHEAEFSHPKVKFAINRVIALGALGDL